MDTVTKPTIVVDYDLFVRKGSEDLQWHVNDRAEYVHLVVVVTDPGLDPYAHQEAPVWDMVIKNTSNLEPFEFHEKAARLLHGTQLQPGVVFTFNEFIDEWYAYGAAVVLTEAP